MPILGRNFGVSVLAKVASIRQRENSNRCPAKLGSRPAFSLPLTGTKRANASGCGHDRDRDSYGVDESKPLRLTSICRNEYEWPMDLSEREWRDETGAGICPPVHR